MNPTFSSDCDGSRTHAKIHRHLVCWRSTVAGVVVSFMTFTGLVALAIAFGGIGLSDGSTAENAGRFGVISLLVAAIVAVFVGSYFSVRLARFKVDMVGSAQGLVVGALVCLFMIWGTVSAVGIVGKAAAQFTGGAAVAAISSSSSAMGISGPVNSGLQDLAEDVLGTSQLKNEPGVVIRGLSSRLMRGDQEAATNYIAAQTGLSPKEATARVAVMRQRVDEMMVKTREVTAAAMKTAGWCIFLLVVLSAISAVIGGLLGTITNTRHTLDVIETSTRSTRREQTAEEHHANRKFAKKGELT